MGNREWNDEAEPDDSPSGGALAENGLPGPVDARRRAAAPARRSATRDGLQRARLEAALYIEALSSELRAIAREADLSTLAYFLEMARIEASIQVANHGAGEPSAAMWQTR